MDKTFGKRNMYAQHREEKQNRVWQVPDEWKHNWRVVAPVLKQLGGVLLVGVFMVMIFLSLTYDARRIEVGKDIAVAHMKDPYSVHFRNLKFKGGSSEYVCGELNARNSMGGYVGYRAFYVNLSTEYFSHNQDDSRYFYTPC